MIRRVISLNTRGGIWSRPVSLALSPRSRSGYFLTMCCQDCGGKLKYYDKVRRIVRTKGRVSKWVNVPRYQCSECGCIHRYLPDYIYPYKQYESEIIAGVIEGLITCETFGYEDYPCEMTMIRWKAHKSQLLL